LQGLLTKKISGTIPLDSTISGKGMLELVRILFTGTVVP